MTSLDKNINVQAYVLIILIIGLLLSLLAMIWLNIPSSSKKSKSETVDVVDSVDYKQSRLIETTEIRKIQGDFISSPKPNSIVTFKTEINNFEVIIPSDYRLGLKYKDVQIQTVFVNYHNSKPTFQLIAISDKSNDDKVLWKSNTNNKTRIRSSQWYLFSNFSDQ